MFRPKKKTVHNIRYLRYDIITVTFAVELLVRLPVTVVAHALVRAHHVLANPVRTYPARPGTLVDVC